MTTEELYEILGDIDERCVKEAREYRIHKKRIRHKWGAIAACLCLVAVGTFITIGLLDEIVKQTNDIQGAVITQHGRNNSVSDENGGLVDKPNNPCEVPPESESVHSDKLNRLVLNTVELKLPLALDIQVDSFGKQSADIQASAIEDFNMFIGIPYEEFISKIPDKFEQCDFYSVSIRSYKEIVSLETYNLHDYVFYYQAKTGENITIALCPFEAPIRDCILVCDNPEKSVINGVSMEIYRYQNTFAVQFLCNGINYDIETSNMTQDGLKELLTCIIS